MESICTHSHEPHVYPHITACEVHGKLSITLAGTHLCAVQEVAKGGFHFPSMFRALSAQGLSPQVSITEQQLTPVALPKLPIVPNTLGRKYESPLIVFRSYRYQVKDKSNLCCWHCNCSPCG